MERFSEALHIGLGAGFIGHVGNALHRSHGATKNNASTSALYKPLSKMMGDIEMRKRIKFHQPYQFATVQLQKLAGIGGTRIRDNKADVEAVGCGGEPVHKSFSGKVLHNNVVFHAILFGEFRSSLLKKSFAPGDEHYIDA